MNSTTPARHAWIDASAGVAGDMLLGALLGAGASLPVVQAAVDAVLPDTVTITVTPVTRAGIRAVKADVEVRVEDHPHRSWRDIEQRLRAAELAAPVRDRAVAVFSRLAEAEGEVHGIAPADVEFHEVGAWDSIADVVGVCAALHDLGVTSISAGVVAVGSGRVTMAHGEVGVPVPAVVALSAGRRVRAGGSGELATPTGMALVVALSEADEDLPELTVSAHGLGAGSRDLPGRANVTRVLIGTRSAGGPPGLDEAVLLEAGIDDLDPRLWPGVLDDLIRAGASDAWLTPILMKKGRPAHQLSVLAPPTALAGLRELVLDRTSTLGVRQYPVAKYALPRGWVDVEVSGVQVSIKVAHRAGLIVRATPEFDSVAVAALTLGWSQAATLAAAVQAASERDLLPGSPIPAELSRP